MSTQQFTHVHDHERTDAKVGPLYLFLAIMGVTLVFSFLFTSVLFEFLTQRAESKSAPAAPLQVVDELPSGPALQVVPGLDLNLMRASEIERLESSGWVDESQRTVHIPIETAIDVLLEKGLPARGAAMTEETAAPAAE